MFHAEIELLQKLFKLKGYPAFIYQKCVNKFLNKKCNKHEKADIQTDKADVTFVIPFIGNASLIFRKKIVATYKKYYDINVRCVFQTFKVRNYFSLKSRTPPELLARCVYKFEYCSDATVSYFGKTKRYLASRIKEYKSKYSKSAILSHLIECQNCSAKFSSQQFTALAFGKNDLEISIKEALLIKKYRPTLNSQQYQNGMSHLLMVF